VRKEMQLTKTILIFTCFLYLFSCKRFDSGEFLVEVTQYGVVAGETAIYKVSNTELEVITNCDLANCKEKTVYSRTLNKNESEQFHNLLLSLQVDTLRKEYHFQGYYDDGYYIKVKLRGDRLPSRTVELDNINTYATDVIFQQIDSLIPEKRFRSKS
jgi:hypothetical protein